MTHEEVNAIRRLENRLETNEAATEQLTGAFREFAESYHDRRNFIDEQLASNSRDTAQALKAITGLAEEFGAHDKKEMAVYNKIIGAWWVISGIAAIALGLVVWVFQDYKAQHELFRQVIQRHAEFISGHTQHHAVEEKRFDRMEQKLDRIGDRLIR